MGEGGTGKSEVTESLIRKMTRLAMQHDAVNLSQGFPNEGPPIEPVLGIASAVIGGDMGNLGIFDAKVSDLIGDDFDPKSVTLRDLLEKIYDPWKSSLNQYSIPYGILPLRQAVAEFYKRHYQWDVDPETEITICAGATEAFASALRTVCGVGDKVLIFEPFHELYPQQSALFYVEPEYTALLERDGEWHIDWEDFEAQAAKCKAVLLNTPHNPTGKVFSYDELERIVNFCVKNDIIIITDEIYEFMIFNGEKHYNIPQTFPQIKDLCVVVNSVSKSCSATGWRIGWAIASAGLTHNLRGMHDQMVLQTATPIQSGVIAYLKMPDAFFSEDIPNKYHRRRDFFIPALRKLGFEVATPNSAYYAFCNYRKVEKIKDMTPMEASLFLVQKVGVATVPGDNFYKRHKQQQGQDYIRFCFVRSDDILQEAIVRLEKWLL